MPRVAWLSDLHLDHASPDAIDELTQQLREAAPDVTLIGGDIGEARNFEQFLRQLESRIPGRLLFVLGNHDYYRSSISTVREAASGSHAEGRTTWLPTAEVVQLDADTAIIGHGGWNDARSGDVEGTSVFLNDYLLIDELREVATPGVMTAELVRQLRALGDDAAQHFRRDHEGTARPTPHSAVRTHTRPRHRADSSEPGGSDCGCRLRSPGSPVGA